MHRSIGYTGIAYHFYVTKDGRIHRGRPMWAMGGHTRGHNDWIGVCAEGAYHLEKEMPPKQLRALQELHDWLEEKRGIETHRRHGDLNATACPGTFYPWRAVIAGVPEKESPIKLTGQSLTLPRTKGVKAGWCNVGFRPWLKRVEAEHPKRATIGPDSIIIPVPEKLPWWWDEMLQWRKSKQVIIRPRKRVPWWRRKR
jgi:hypothetical protein